MAQHRNAPLAGMKIVEISAFVAAPLGAMTLQQLGAEVIRIDPIGGNIDYNRWPVSDDGTSIYWASLNKGKRSVALNLKSEEGQRIATELIADAGALITNLPARGWLSYENLRQHREDLLMLRLTGTHNGDPAVDYTVNAAGGFPYMTGDGTSPVNHVLPAWDLLAGMYIANGMLAAELERRASGHGQEVKLALSDVMLATLGNLGYIAEVQTKGSTRGALGNGLYGAYGQSFHSSDNREIMVVVISNRHWRSLGEATGLTEQLAMIGPMLGTDLSTEGGRYESREAIDAVLRPWFAARTAADATAALRDAGVLQGIFQTVEELVGNDEWVSKENPIFSEIYQPGVGSVLAPRIPLEFRGSPTADARIAPKLGEQSGAVLAEALGLSDDEIMMLRDDGTLAG